ncbi:hypothetical protein HD_0416 [[Haemophilus] ducreyi 35000HP]|uniref:Uncharacterized protein n=1 Tax=Haemophilus ducreyi (strain 35000HP / ATCC 700724) TaxID=233412 RepID=Q7VNS1_HAEDU|nr:hypothetical protein HD_0416 [[Haemophilus] ducreyi 35000HP]
MLCSNQLSYVAYIITFTILAYEAYYAYFIASRQTLFAKNFTFLIICLDIKHHPQEATKNYLITVI